ncbi:hypothetical protein E2I00_004946 [Balaenoptera physalus]|uniref:Transforming acidic coiled-coil-containing protein C-terminal domain-containing protein n=1 Tax=Balaenoptera physalus TaxID=9770 RepID=A0A643C026_BALPH|nr:hypothetical protein E2I00_004946 [Balaenoptera physalus]
MESPLRKQSVYCKFDPLLKDSPQRPTPVTPETGSAGEADAPSSGSPPEAKLVEFDFFRARDAPVPGWPCVSSGRGWFEKQKDLIRGYHTYEEALKKCVEDYIERIEKEGQRYQALEAHSGEKLKLTNEEIAQILIGEEKSGKIFSQKTGKGVCGEKILNLNSVKKEP